MGIFAAYSSADDLVKDLWLRYQLLTPMMMAPMEWSDGLRTLGLGACVGV
jgi:hypothetical protein